jgi:hypothetical protein
MCSEKSLEEFAASVLDGTAEAEYKSAPIPDEPTDGGVSIIVGKNFDSIVKDADKDVLLEVRHCAVRRFFAVAAATPAAAAHWWVCWAVAAMPFECVA